MPLLAKVFAPDNPRFRLGQASLLPELTLIGELGIISTYTESDSDALSFT